jgi:Leucine-rich repeat (LRR) protein
MLATDVVVADANGNELTYSYDSADGPATFKAVKTYATDEAKAGRIIIADNITDGNGNSHVVMYISGSVGNRSNLVSIVFGKNIVAVGGPQGNSDDAFYNCSKLESVTLNANLEILGRYAFQACPLLESINLEDCTNLKTMRYRCFQNSGLKTVTIPTSVETFDGDLFGSCPLETITFLAENVPANFYQSSSTLATINIGPGVKSIGDYGFRYNRCLKNLNIDTQVSGFTVGKYAFSECDTLRILRLPAGVIELKEYAFSQIDSLKTVIIAEGSQLHTIGNDAFYNDITLEQINLEAATQLKSIGSEALYRCYELKSITIPASVEAIVKNILWYSNKIETITFLAPTIPADFYASAESLRTLNIGSGVKSIGNNAFAYIRTLAALNIDPAVDGLAIGNSAFRDCDALKSCHLPVGVVSLGEGIFASCDSLHTFTFAEGSPITAIPYNTFPGCTSLEKIKIPDAVKTIATGAFYNCSSLREIEFGTGLEEFAQDWGLFYNCPLEKVTLPGINYPFKGDSPSNYLNSSAVLYVNPLLVETYRGTSYTQKFRIMAIGSTTEYAVTTAVGGELQSKLPEDLAQYTQKLTVSGPLNGTDIDYLHSSFPLIEELNLKNARIVSGGDAYHQWNISSNGTATIETWYGPWETEDNVISRCMFYNMPTLKSLLLPKDATKIGEWAMGQDRNQTYKLKTIELPSGVTEIGQCAFQYTGIEEVDIPAGVTRLEQYTFSYCKNLKKATLPDGITYIGYSCFSEDTELLDVNIPANIETIDEYAFYNNQKRSTPIVFPSTLKTIGGHAFRNNYRVKSVTFNDGLKTIGSWAFSDCNDIESITLPETVTTMYDRAFQSCDSITQFTFPSSITAVPEAVLYHCDKLQTVTLASGTTSIAGNAFENCPQLATINLTEQTSLTSIGNHAFGNTGFTKVTLPNSITSMGYSAFRECQKLQSINVPTGLTTVPYDFVYSCPNLTGVQMHDGIRVVGHYAFTNCPLLNGVVLNDQITDIEYDAFNGCSSLELTKLPDALTHIGSSAFYNTKSMRGTFTIPSTVTSVDESAFNGSGIDGIVFTKPATTIARYTFSNTPNLSHVVLPSAITNIKDHTFYKASSLKQIDLPETVTRIEYNAFDLSGLESIELPENLTHIGSYAFASTQLTSFRMPDGFTGSDYGSYFLAYNYHLKSAHLGRNMDYTGYTDMSTFYGCDSLELLRLYTATPPKASSTSNFGFRSKCVLEVPEGSEENYRTSEYVWKEFKEIRGFFTGDELAEADFAVLKDIYEKLDNTQWKTSWDLTNNHNPNGKWPGVSTAKRGSETSLIYGITDIDLSAMGLTGQLPESIFRLKDLKTLNLSYNHISGNAGEIINAIADNKRAPLTDLNLRGNEITGDAFAIASALPELTKLNLSYNQLTDVSQVIDKTTLTDLNMEMQFIDWYTKQPVAAAAEVAQDMTAGVPAAIKLPTTFTYRHSYQDFNRDPSNLYRPYCTNIDYNYWNNTYELAKTDGLWNMDTYDTRMLRAPKNQPVAYAMDWLTVILRFTWEDGDVNADQTVDVTDLQSVLNFAFNERKYNGELFNFADADCNSDNVINVSDVVGNVERILAYTPADAKRARRIYKVQENTTNVISMESTDLMLHNTDAVAAMQLTIVNASQHDISVSSDLRNRFTVMMRQIDDGVRIVIYSVDGHTLQSGNHTLLCELPAGAIVTDVCLSDADAHHLGFTIDGAEATSIDQLTLNGNRDIQVYDLSGRRTASWQSLPSGVYVIRVNGKQYKVKK